MCTYVCEYIYTVVAHCGCLKDANSIQYFNRLSSSRESHGGIICIQPHTLLLSPFRTEWRQFAPLFSSNIFCYKLFFSMVTQIFASHLFHLLFIKLYFKSFIFSLLVSYSPLSLTDKISLLCF